MKYYILDQRYGLCGWQKLPYALTEMKSSKIAFLNGKEFQALSACNGVIDTDGILVTPEMRRMIQEAEKKGIVSSCEKGTKMLAQQVYHQYPCRYIETAHWSMTGMCNYRCKHCYMSAPDAKFGELSHGQCVDIIEQMAECGIKNLSLTGGECLVRKDFIALVDLMLEKNMHIKTIYSNGKLVTQALLDQLKERNLFPEFNISFDGVGWHDWLRGIDGAEKYALDAFRLCRDNGFPTGAEMCIHQGNKHTLRETMKLLSACGVAHVKTNPVSDTELWTNYTEDYSISFKELYEVYLSYIPEYYEDGAPISLMLGGFFQAKRHSVKYVLPSLQDQNLEPERRCVCGHARVTMYISADGRILPCMPLSAMDNQDSFPSILEMTLKEALTDSYYMDIIDTRFSEILEHNPECRDCPHKMKCGGGCRAAALMTTKEFLGRDLSFCEIYRGGYEKKIYETADEAIKQFSPNV